MGTRAGFTIIELVAGLCAIAVLAACAVAPMSELRRQARREEDCDHLRKLHTAFLQWAQGNSEDFPRPSRLDKANYVLTCSPEAKDTTANIYSCLIFNGAIEPGLLVSPVETNAHVVPYLAYEFDQPKGTAQPMQAIWDPKLSAVLDGSKPGNLSYAHTQPFGARRARYTNSWSSTEIHLATRGPEVLKSTRGIAGTVIPTFATPGSNTLRFFGSGDSWGGWVMFADDHAEFRSRYLSHAREFWHLGVPAYVNKLGQSLPDIWCFDEPDDSKAANEYVGIFLQSGKQRTDWIAAWD